MLDSDDPTSVLQPVPGHRAAPLNLTILGLSLVIAVGALILWPVAFLLRKRFQRPLALMSEARRWRLFLRLALLFDVLWIACWTAVLTPVLNTQLDVYSTALDPVIRTFQVAGVIVIALAAVALWSFVRVCRLDSSWLGRLGTGAIAGTLLGLAWTGLVGGLITFDLNY